MLKCVKILIIAMGFAVCATGWAEDATVASDEKPKVKGLEMVTDVVGDVGNKAVALMSGNLEMTMELDKNRPSKGDYTYNALGQRVPKASATKTGGALHN